METKTLIVGMVASLALWFALAVGTVDSLGRLSASFEKLAASGQVVQTLRETPHLQCVE